MPSVLIAYDNDPPVQRLEQAFREDTEENGTIWNIFPFIEGDPNDVLSLIIRKAKERSEIRSPDILIADIRYGDSLEDIFAGVELVVPGLLEGWVKFGWCSQGGWPWDDILFASIYATYSSNNSERQVLEEKLAENGFSPHSLIKNITPFDARNVVKRCRSIMGI